MAALLQPYRLAGAYVPTPCQVSFQRWSGLNCDSVPGIPGYNYDMEEVREKQTHLGEQVWEWRNMFVDKFLGLFPRQTAEHLVNAQKEGVLAIRSLLDCALEALDGDLKRTQERPSKH